MAPLLLGLTAFFAWWALEQGAYFGAVFYPGAVAVAILIIVAAIWGPSPIKLTRSAAVSLCAIFGLAALTALSAIWSPTPSAALEYSTRVLIYGSLVGVGIWTTAILGTRMTLATLPIAVAGLIVAAVTIGTIALGADIEWYLHDDGTLRFPLGYRNANAAFFTLCAWPLITLALQESFHWAARAGAIAGATALLELAVLSQSRGWMPATALAVLAFLIFSPRRLKSACLIALVVLPACLALPVLLDVFRDVSDREGTVQYLREAARAVTVTTLLSFALAAFTFVVLRPLIRPGPARVRQIGRILAVSAGVACLVGVVLFLERQGGPVTFIEDRVAEFKTVGYPDLSEQETRYGVNVGSNRGDFWRVSIDMFARDPVIGMGSGAFRPEYLMERRSVETPHDPHSVEMLLAGELGILGLALFVAFLVAAGVCLVRSRSLGMRSALLATAVVAAVVQWLMPASYDWFWQYPGVTAPAMFLIGVGIGPAVLAPGTYVGKPLRWAVAAPAMLIIVCCLPLLLADRYSKRALDSAADSPVAALQDIDRAAKLAPLDPDPLITKAQIAWTAGRPGVAKKAIASAIEREPSNYRANLVRAQILIEGGEDGAKAAIARLRELNPLAEEADELEMGLKSH